MGRIIRANGSDVAPIKSDGTSTSTPNGKQGYTLLSGTTYYYPLGGNSAPLESCHVQWDASIIITAITIEDTNFDDVTNYSATSGEWISENPSTAYISTTSHNASTGGATVTASTIAVAGGTAGGCMYHLGNTGAKRTRLSVVVGGTGGVLRVATHGKD